MKIANLVISILSLIATIAISFVIYFLEKKKTELLKQKEIKENAKNFIVSNSDEIDYLHWATIAAGCFPQNKHVRKIYNEFSLLDNETKQEVLKQRNLKCELITDDAWIQSKIQLIREAITLMDLGDDYLYDSGKYFTRSYRYKGEPIPDFEAYRDVYDDVFHLNRPFQKHKDKLTYIQYLEDYLYCKYAHPELLTNAATIIKPNDYLIAAENFGSCREDYLCFWMMIMVSYVAAFAIRHLKWKDAEHPQTDAQPKTFEDKYFSVLYDLYYLKKE